MNSSVRRVAVLGGVRIPFARQSGPYARASNQDMLTATLDALINKYSLEGEVLGEVAAGAVLKHSRDFNLTRESVLGTRLAPQTPAYDVQQACGTGLETTIVPEIPRNAEPRTGLSMGEHAAITAREWGLTREEQDELAVRSHRKLAAAYDTGFLDDLVIPFLGLERDQNLRPDTTVEKLAKLPPVFGGPEGTMTAGNSTPLSDGAAAVLLSTDEWAAERDLPVQAYITAAQTAAVDHVHKREGLLMAPTYAVPKMLARAGLTLQDFDFYEIHEAFASQVLCTLKAWQDPVYCRERLELERPLGSIDRDKLNVHGGSLAAGHPFGATGGRIVAGLAKMLSENGSGRGLISICAAGGLGVTAILET